MPDLHKVQKGDTFTMGEGPWAPTCDVTKVCHEEGMVHYRVRKDNSPGFFYIGSPQHEFVKWWQPRL